MDDLTSLEWLNNISIVEQSEQKPISVVLAQQQQEKKKKKLSLDYLLKNFEAIMKKGQFCSNSTTTATTTPPPRPPFSYATLILLALHFSTPTHKATLSQIYAWIKSTFPYYNSPTTSPAWKNSIRHNLSLNKCFVKIARRSIGGEDGNNKGKGGYWMLDPECERKLLEGDNFYRLRKKRQKKKQSQKKGNKSSKQGAVQAMMIQDQIDQFHEFNDKSYETTIITAPEYEKEIIIESSAPNTTTTDTTIGPIITFIESNIINNDGGDGGSTYIESTTIPHPITNPIIIDGTQFNIESTRTTSNNSILVEESSSLPHVVEPIESTTTATIMKPQPEQPQTTEQQLIMDSSVSSTSNSNNSSTIQTYEQRDLNELNIVLEEYYYEPNNGCFEELELDIEHLISIGGF